jgi:F420H(2)-dependent quinone reductase
MPIGGSASFERAAVTRRPASQVRMLAAVRKIVSPSGTLTTLPARLRYYVWDMTIEGTYTPSALDWVREQVELYERTGGQEGNTLRDTGIPVIIVTMRGAKSGNVRKIALMRVEHNGEYALVASYGGRPENPVWYANLLADPNIMFQDGPAPVAMQVREVFGMERDEWFARSAEVFPTYLEYQEKTDRTIPVLIASAQ